MTFRIVPLKATALFSLGLLAASFASLSTLTGCGISGGTAASTLPPISGYVHGGQSPTQNSTVTLYVTNTTATTYGAAATVIGTATTDAGGNFTISPSATTTNCPSGSQAYITAAGGYQSGQSTLTNNSMLLMVALGDCLNVNANTHVILNEVTTVAAAYALSGFMTTAAASSGPLYVANVSAPAANRAAIGSTTAAAGLAHAFLNAQALANISVGLANYVTPTLTSAGASITGTVPAVEINTLGDILQSCVDGATSNSNCTKLFGFTPSITGVAPVNTLQSMINLARNPYPSAAAMNSTTGLLSLASGFSAFTPTLTAIPNDWALAIAYHPASSVIFYNLAVDANDTVWGGEISAADIVGLSPYGTSTKAFTAAVSGTATRQVAPDAKGNIWVGNNATLLMQYSATGGGAPTNTYTFTETSGSSNGVSGVAVDAAGNVWVGNATASATGVNVVEYIPSTAMGATATTPYVTNYTGTTPSSNEPVTVKVDAAQNIWVADYYLSSGISGGTYAITFPNLTPVTSSAPTATPTYAASGLTANPVDVAFAGTNGKTPIDVVFDIGGNAWYELYSGGTNTTVGIEEVEPTLNSSSVITALVPQTEIANAALNTVAVGRSAIDGAGSIFIPDNGTAGLAGLHVYSTVSSTSSSETSSQVISPPAGYLGCAIPAGTTTCGTTTAEAIYNPRSVAIDSTGSVWSTNTTGDGGMTQTIGLAAPTWPLLSTGLPSVAPGLTNSSSVPTSAALP